MRSFVSHYHAFRGDEAANYVPAGSQTCVAEEEHKVERVTAFNKCFERSLCFGLFSRGVAARFAGRDLEPLAADAPPSRRRP